ncbi:hypothetical protein ZWY2020_024130 [Hordeum vulgare]|nr:hypothetical protein ZWY2020_024130 [Hordeum vulgare]
MPFYAPSTCFLPRSHSLHPLQKNRPPCTFLFFQALLPATSRCPQTAPPDPATASKPGRLAYAPCRLKRDGAHPWPRLPPADALLLHCTEHSGDGGGCLPHAASAGGLCSGLGRLQPCHSAKALEKALDIPRESIQVASAHPEDYLIRFSEPFQRDLALERGYVRVEGTRLQLEQWEPVPAGTIRNFRFYCRLAISGIKFHAWRLDVVKKLLGSSCIVGRMGATRRLQNVLPF